MANYPYYQTPVMASPYQQMQTQPYQDRLAQLQSNYQQAMPYGQMQMQQPIQQVPQFSMLQGQMVDGIDNLTEMWSDADATLRQSMKTDLTRLIQQMN